MRPHPQHPCHNTAHRRGFPFGTTLVVKEGEANDCLVDFSIVRMRAGETIESSSSSSPSKESAWVLLDGVARVSVDGAADVSIARASLFDERPSVVSLPAQARARFHAERDTEFAVVHTPNRAHFAPKVFLPADTSSEQRGKGLAQEASLRIVRLTFDLEKRPESMLVVGEVVHLPGRWSSYPPHHHQQPELYHYRFTKPQGFGHAELGDDVVKVKQFDTVKILDGVDHPQVAAPGYGMYYLWIVRHQADAKYTGFTFTHEHEWILDGKDQGWTPKELA